MTILFGIITILHGLVHLWYVTLNQGLIEFKPEMGWTGKSWLLTDLLSAEFTRPLATIFYGVSAITFVVAGVGLITSQSWTRLWILVASSISAASIILFWDGNFEQLVEKGLIGLLINAAFLISAIWLGWLEF
jgi:hypothetical protein